VNFIDVYFRTGLYPRPLPFVAGLEGAGRVESVGPGVVGLAAGDRVAWASVPGSYAEAVVAPAALLVRVPDAVDDEIAAAAMLQGMTAHYLVHGCRTTQAGDVALVHAAAGGVGLLLIQLLVEAGATVIGTCSSPEKEKLAREAGAAHVLGYDAFADEARQLTGGRGCDVVYDSVGQTTFDKGFNCLAPRGMMALYGQSSGPIGPFDPQTLNAKGSLFLTRPSLNHHIITRAELLQRSEELLGWIRDGKVKLRTEFEFPLKDASEAHRALEGRKTTGKVLLIP
jgi:NADPH2:quinone reductase